MGESAGMQQEVSVEAEEWSVSMHMQSTTRAEENSQHTSTGVDDAPRAPPEPPQPPDEAANQQNEPPSVELEGERIPNPSCDVRRTRAEANMSGPSEDNEDARAEEAGEHVGSHQQRLEAKRSRRLTQRGSGRAR